MVVLLAFARELCKAVKLPVIETEALFKVKHKLCCFFVILRACNTDIVSLLVIVAVA